MEWWDANTAGMVGGILGAGIGTSVGLLGAFVGRAASRGALKASAVWAMGAAGALGIALTITAVVAIAIGQPYHVWYPLMLPGLITAAVCLPLTGKLKTQVRAAEARRLDAAALRQAR